MGNMSYCRFQNTLADLEDCYDAWEEKAEKDLSLEEQRARKRLIKVCENIAADYGDRD
jgi:hypothetical protein